VSDLRAQGLETELDLSGRSLKAQLKEADRGGYRKVAIFGPQEAGSDVMTLRDMTDGSQTKIPTREMVHELSGGVS